MLDIIASRVHGAVTAKDCRVVWTDGKLYVCRTVADIVVLDSPEPKRIGGAYKASTEQGDVRIQPPGCGSCRARVRASDVGQMSVEAIVAASFDAVVDTTDPAAFQSVGEAFASLSGQTDA